MSSDSDAPKRRSGLGQAAAHGAAYSGVAQAIKIFITMISTIVVARILSPSDYGVIAMTAPVTGFILIFQNLGLNQAIVQAKTLSDDQINALFFYNMAASGLVALLFVLISPLIGIFYGDIRPAFVMAASAATVLITGSALQHSALLNRGMRYKALSFVDVVSAIATFAFTIGFALWLRSYWSLWLGTFAGAVVGAMLLWKIDSWRPGRHVNWRNARHLVTFGANLTGFNVLNFLSRNLDNVLIAKFWGAGALGLYERSYRLMMFPILNINQPLSRIMLPALSRVQDQPERYRRMFVLAIRSVSLASVPGIVTAAICSDRLVPFLLGERWSNASPIFFWLSLAAILQPVSNATGWLFISAGRTKELFRWSMFATPLIIGSFVAGLPWGAVGVARAYFVVQLCCAPILFKWSTRNSPIRTLDLYATILPALAGGAIAWLVDSAIRNRIPVVAELILVAAVSYLLTAIAQAATAEGRGALGELLRLLKSAFLRRRKTL